MGNAVLQKLRGLRTAEAQLLIKALGVGLGLQPGAPCAGFLPGGPDAPLHQRPAQAGPPVHREHPADLGGSVLRLQNPQAGLNCPSAVPGKHVPGPAVQTVRLLVGTALLHHKDGGAHRQQVIELISGELVPVLDKPIHGSSLPHAFIPWTGADSTGSERPVPG